MPFGRTVVETAQIDTAAGQMKAGAADIRRALDSLLKEVTGLTGDGWQGRASAAFGDTYHKLNTGWQQVEDALISIGQQLHGTSATYTDVEEQLVRAIQR